MNGPVRAKFAVIEGAAFGCSAWIVYGALETVLSVGAKLYHHPDMHMMPWQWRLIAMLMGVYAASGLIWGAAADWILGWIGQHGVHARQFAASFSVALAFGANLILARPSAWPQYVGLALAAAICLAFSAASVYGELGKQILFLANPWVTAFLLLAAPWVNWDALVGQSRLARAGGVALLFAAIAVFAAFVHRLRRNWIPSALRHAGAAGLALAAIFLLDLIRATPASIRTQPVAPAPQAGKPNIVLITMDTVRADHLPLYGYGRDTAPNLRELARSATLYTRAMATSDFTLPTHASIFTGLYAPWHGARIGPASDPRPRPLSPQLPSLPELLASSGYWTAESVANWAFLAPWTGLSRGFLVSEWERPVDLSSGLYPFYLRTLARRALGPRGELFDEPYRRAGDITARAEALLEQAKRNARPFFLFLNYMDAHWPYALDGPSWETMRRLRSVHNFTNQVNFGAVSLSPIESGLLQSAYDGGIASVDSAIGAVVQQLRALGLYENTLIAVVADHGEGFMSHGLLGHGAGVVYQENLHIPLVVKYPGQNRPLTSDLLASQVDLMPTILAAAGIPAPLGLQGRNLKEAQAADSDAIFASARALFPSKKSRKIQGTRRAVLSGTLKFIQWTAGASEMYDLAADPEEKTNLYAANDPRAIELQRRLERWTAAAPALRDGSQKLDDSVIERLKSLGYVQ
ncbi:MAG TPA: sulfatase [Bryobacteraceae bacterium]|nr:sulfatase [Bryobacteraceae bacterium]